MNLIADRARSGQMEFSPPQIFPVLKDAGKHSFRPISSFFLSDKIIENITARYLGESLDRALSSSCFAVRPRMDGRPEALTQIQRFRSEHATAGLYVAECDLMGFFDCVSHDIARESLYMLVDEAQRIDPKLQIDPIALQIVDAYLECYSFWRNVRNGAEVELKHRDALASYPWRDEELTRLHRPSTGLDRIGIPQGGAISAVIANAVLHRADKVMQPFCAAGRGLYERYCDDTILSSPDRSACQEAFERYCDALEQLKLPIHEPKAVQRYERKDRRAFWETKSKAVYHWGDPHSRNSVPWIQFLGYQIRYDGVVRVRRSSINKEMEKLARQTNHVLRMLRPTNVENLRKSARSIMHRVRMKLISHGVGRRGLAECAESMQKCWAKGFQWLAARV
jgi:hypothetical protein